MLLPEAAPRNGVEQNIENSATIVGYRDSEGSWQTLGIRVQGGVALFEPDSPYNFDEQVVASLLMLGDTNEIMSKRMGLPMETVDKQVYALLEKAGTNRGGLLYNFLTSPKPVMRINRLIENRWRNFPPRLMDAVGALVRGRTEDEMAEALSISTRTVQLRIKHIAEELEVNGPHALLAAALILSDQAGLSASICPAAAPLSSLEPSELKPALLETHDENNIWNRPGIRLLGGFAVFERNNPLTRRRQQIAALAMLGSSNGEISKNLGIAENTTKTLMRCILQQSGAQDRYSLLPAFLTIDPPWMRLVRPIHPDLATFSPWQVQVGSSLLRRSDYGSVAEELGTGINGVKHSIRSAPSGLRGQAQFITALTMSGQVDGTLAVIASERREALRE